MESSPFRYGVTVSKAAFTNREPEAQKLESNLIQGINTCIISPRRWGKSSLVEKVVGDIKEKHKDFKVCILDLFTVSSEEEFLELFTREILRASSNKWEEWVKEGKVIFKQLVPKFSIGLDPETDFSVSFDWSELKKHKDEILDLPEKIAKRKKIKFIVCLDEFQNIASFKDFEPFEKKMRAVWQRQKHVSYCLFGSKRHMMNDIFNNPSKPFYRFGDMILLGKISRDKWVSFIQNGFANTGKKIDTKNADLIASSMKLHSWYVQQLAHYTWNKTEMQGTQKEVYNALLELIQANTPFYQKEIEGLSSTQVNLLKAIAADEFQLTSAAVMQKYRLGTPRNVSKNKTTLLNADIIDESDGRYEFLDPAFEMWFRKQFFNQHYLGTERNS
jgi:AAA+ ATPase superfamily predicted ATPase